MAFKSNAFQQCSIQHHSSIHLHNNVNQSRIHTSGNYYCSLHGYSNYGVSNIFIKLDSVFSVLLLLTARKREQDRLVLETYTTETNVMVEATEMS